VPVTRRQTRPTNSCRSADPNRKSSGGSGAVGAVGGRRTQSLPRLAVAWYGTTGA
jgi:hypothetical protein